MLANLECSVDTVVLFMWMNRMWFSEFIHRCHQKNVSDGAKTMKRLAIHKLRDRYFTPIFYTTYNAQCAHDYRLLCFQMYVRTRTGTMEPTKSHKVALFNHTAILHLSRSIGVNGHVRNRFCNSSSRSAIVGLQLSSQAAEQLCRPTATYSLQPKLVVVVEQQWK